MREHKVLREHFVYPLGEKLGIFPARGMSEVGIVLRFGADESLELADIVRDIS